MNEYQPKKKYQRNRHKYTANHFPSHKPIAKTLGQRVPIQGKSGHVRSGVRRETPDNPHLSAMEPKGSVPIHELRVKLTGKEFQLLTEFMSRCSDDIPKSEIMLQAIVEYIKNNPPVKKANRCLLRLCDDRNKTILYKKKMGAVDIGHIRMVDYDPVTQTRTSDYRPSFRFSCHYSPKS